MTHVPGGSSMFSIRQKREIAEKVQTILLETEHPKGEISFTLNVIVSGAEQWSWSEIKNNGAVPSPTIVPNPTPLCSTGYECGICSCYHPANWDGDCRDDANRYAHPDVFDNLINMEDVDKWRRNPCT